MTGGAEFLVEIEIDTGDLDSEAVDELRHAEAVRARELAALGHLVSLWRVPGRWANIGVWRADSESALTVVLDSLPLRPYMKVRVNPLDPHPSDPRAHARPRRDSGAGSGLSPLPDLMVRRRRSVPASIRSADFELQTLPELTVRRRSARGARGLRERFSQASGRRHREGGGIVVATAGARETSEVDALTPRGGRVVLWSDLDVTRLLAREARADALSAVRGYVAEAALTHLEGEALQNLRLEITESASLGVDGLVVVGESIDVCVDIGAPKKRTVVRTTSGGDDLIQIGTFVRIAVSTAYSAEAPDRVACFFAELRSRVESRVADGR